MNPFLFAAGVLYLGGTAWALWGQDYRMGFVYFCYGLSSFALGWWK